MSVKFSKQSCSLLSVIVLSLFGVIVYSNTFYCSFHLDDYPSITENLLIRNILNLRAIWNFCPTRFITYLSAALNYHLNHLNVFGYHLFNLSVHICTTIMVWWLMLLTFSTPAMSEKKIARHADLIAFFGALVFMAHPLQTQGVTYIIERAASLATFFYLLSLTFYIKSRLSQQQTKDPAVSRTFYCGSLIAAVMAMLTKEISITLPLAVLLFEICFLKTKEKFNWKYIVPLFVTMLIIPLTILLAKSSGSIGLRIKPASEISACHYLFTQSRVIVTYIRLLFIPINQNLDYDYRIVKSLLEWPALSSLIFLLLILITER